MFEKPVIDLPRTAPNEEPVSTELAETENLFDSFSDEIVDLEDSAPVIEMPFQAVRGPAVRAPIYATPESRPERTLPRAAREQIARERTVSQPTPSIADGDDPFAALMKRFNG